MVTGLIARPVATRLTGRASGSAPHSFRSAGVTYNMYYVNYAPWKNVEKR